MGWTSALPAPSAGLLPGVPTRPVPDAAPWQLPMPPVPDTLTAASSADRRDPGLVVRGLIAPGWPRPRPPLDLSAPAAVAPTVGPSSLFLVDRVDCCTWAGAEAALPSSSCNPSK